MTEFTNYAKLLWAWFSFGTNLSCFLPVCWYVIAILLQYLNISTNNVEQKVIPSFMIINFVSTLYSYYKLAQERKSLYLIEFTLAETQVHRNNSRPPSILLMSVYPLRWLLCEKKIVHEILSTININWSSLGVGNKLDWPTFSEINMRIHLITNWWSNGNIKQIY